MARLREHSLRTLLLVLGSAGVAVLVLITIGVGFRTSQVSAEADRVVNLTVPAVEDVATITLAASEMERGLTQYVLSGAERDLRPFVDGERRSALALDSLTDLVGSDPQVEQLLAAVSESRDRWLDTIARPAIAAVRADRIKAARARVSSDLNTTLFDDFITDTDRLRNTISAAVSAGFAELRDLADRLTRLLALALVFLVTGLVIAWYVLANWVRRPLEDLRKQVRDIARSGHHHRPIAPSGPREVAAVGADTEMMRRQLVAEIDEAKAAREALAHDAPIAEAIRQELTLRTDPDLAGIRVHGEVRPAEGVLAGDWWDCVRMPTGEAALVITDIAGHGPSAGVTAIRIKHLLTAALGNGAAPDEALGLVGRTFASGSDPFATIAIVCIHPDTGAVRWANAGHHPPLLIRADAVAELGRTGPLMSWLGGPWRVAETQLGPADLLLLYSDGLIESRDQHGEELEVSGLLGLLRSLDQRVAGDEAVRRILAHARERAVDWERDDVTLVALWREPFGQTPTIPLPRPQAQRRR